MSPNQYVRVYRLNENVYFDEKGFLKDLDNDMHDIYDKLNPTMVHVDRAKLAIDQTKRKFEAIMRKSKLDMAKGDLLWRFFFAKYCVAFRNAEPAIAAA